MEYNAMSIMKRSQNFQQCDLNGWFVNKISYVYKQKLEVYLYQNFNITN